MDLNDINFDDDDDLSMQQETDDSPVQNKSAVNRSV